MLGSRIAARQWLLAAGGTSDSVVEELTIMNDGDANATVTLSAVDADAPKSLGEPLVVPSGGFVQVRLNDLIERTPLTVLVEGDAPVVVERGLIYKGENGTSRQLGVPLS
jgi:hypothetical protein